MNEIFYKNITKRRYWSSTFPR